MRLIFFCDVASAQPNLSQAPTHPKLANLNHQSRHGEPTFQLDSTLRSHPLSTIPYR